VTHSLHYPQVPLVQTMLQTTQHMEYSPCGINCVVAICAYSGFSQEDAIIINKAALDRGLFRSTCCKSFRDEQRASGNDAEIFGPLPPSTTGLKKADYSKTEADGTPAVGTVIASGDVIISKRLVTHALGDDRKRKVLAVDHSTQVRSAEDLAVDKVFLTLNRDGSRLVKIRLAATRTPEVGDKFSSHHGQKGVIGLVLPEVDMPFMEDGTVPDLLISPHCVPSRMTVGMLAEMLLGKACCLRGLLGDGTPFERERASVESIGRELAQYGYESRGNETLFNGFTGQWLPGSVFVGPVHYQRLRHHVIDKVHARSRGPMTILTRQPVEGRSRNGAGRMGEMERDVLIAHGSTALLTERLMKTSDEFEVPICRSCGLFAEALAADAPLVHPDRKLWCRNCKLAGPAHVAMVKLPYAFKLFVNEVSALGVHMRLKIRDIPAEEA
jgi:DNA-directed RNA polymerase II subunit RPB2